MKFLQTVKTVYVDDFGVQRTFPESSLRKPVTQTTDRTTDYSVDLRDQGVCHLTCSPPISDDLPADNTCLHTAAAVLVKWAPSHILTKPPPLHNIPSCGAESKQQGATVVRHPVPTTQTSRPNQRRHSDAMYTFTQGPDVRAFRLENGRIYQARSVSQWELVQVIKLPQLAPKCPGQRPRGDWDDTVALGLWVVDPHGYQAYQTRPLATYEEATANYPDRWSRLSTR
ncbi:hypothetical protein Bbelb_390050 [Branchiostoma belcheri]|nr:hypothetical protein Bbelb_390050 [Branchiostoma belcheri]